MDSVKLKSYFNKKKGEAGCDEAGRGCLAGPVFAAAVLLPANFYHPLLNDSKKLNKKTRDLLREVIEKESLDWAVANIDNHEIDQINILNASILAMHKAIDQLKETPGYLIIDGNKFKPYKQVPYSCIIKGDGKYASIAAASILAKTHRDEYMEKLSSEFPEYNWQKNKGYPTRQHREAIKTYGITNYHRRSYRLPEDQLEIDFENE